MSTGPILLVIHESPLRAVSEAEALSTLVADEHVLPRRIERIDTRHLHDDVEGAHWRTSHLHIREEAARLRAAADTIGASKIRYLGIAEVPQVLALGAYLGDERLIEVRDYDRDRNVWDWPREDASLDVVTLNAVHDRVDQPGAAVLRVEISYPILDADIDAAIGRDRLSNIRIVPDGIAPAPGLVRSSEDVARIRAAVRAALASLAASRPNVDVIHLFVAAPVSVCVAIGQELRLRNGKDVQTYRYRAGTGDRALVPAILLTNGESTEDLRALSDEEIALAQSLRATWQEALQEVRQHARLLSERRGANGRWYEGLEPLEVFRFVAPFPGLRPIYELVDDRDCVALDVRPSEFRFDKDRRQWELNDELLLGMFDAAGRDRSRLREHARLFFWHEYVHDAQGLTAYTSVDIGRLANCLERVDYQADTYAVLHQIDYLTRSAPNDIGDARRYQELVVQQIEAALLSFWAFEPRPPLKEMQERRLRRYLNWYWRRVRLRGSRDLEALLRALAEQPCVEISGLRRRLGADRIFVVLDDPGGFSRLHIGIVLEDGRLKRLSSSTDASIEELLRAFTRRDHEAIERYFNSLAELVK